MDSVLTTLSQPASILLAICILGLIALLVSVILMRRRLASVTQEFQSLLVGASGNNLEQLLIQHIHENAAQAARIDEMEQRTVIIERKLARSKRHLGIMRYDAFDEIGGQQSFSLAIFDDNGDGAVLSSIIGREESRVFGKAILGGKASLTLTNEEQQAIMSATGTGGTKISS